MNNRTHGRWYVYWLSYKVYLMLQTKSKCSMQKFCSEDKLPISWCINLLIEHQLLLHGNAINLNITQQRRQCTYKVTLIGVRVTIVTVKKYEVLHLQSVSVAKVIQQSTRMQRIMISPVACLALQYSSTLSHKRYDFRKKFIEHKVFVLIFSTTVWNNSHSKKFSEMS